TSPNRSRVPRQGLDGRAGEAPRGLGNVDLDVHAGLLVAGDAAIDVVRAALQVDRQLRRLPGADDGSLLVVDARPVEDQVVADVTLVRQIEGVRAWGKGRVRELDLELDLRHGDALGRGRRRGRYGSGRSG